MKNLIPPLLALASFSLSALLPAFAQTPQGSDATERLNEVFEKTMSITREEKSLSAFERRLSELGAIITADEVPGQKLAFVEMPKQPGRPRLFYVCIVYRIEAADTVAFVRGEAVNVDLRTARPR